MVRRVFRHGWTRGNRTWQIAGRLRTAGELIRRVSVLCWRVQFPLRLGIVGTIGNPNFGRPQGPQVGARIITMGLRLDF